MCDCVCVCQRLRGRERAEALDEPPVRARDEAASGGPRDGPGDVGRLLPGTSSKASQAHVCVCDQWLYPSSASSTAET